MLFPLAGLFSQITHVSFGGNPELEDHLDLSILVGSEGNITFVSPIERIVMRLPKSDSGESTNTTGDGLVITGYNPNTKLLFATASVLMQKYSSGSTTAIANLIHVFYLLNLVPKISPVVLEGSSFTQPVVECKPFEDYEKDLALAAITAKVYREMDKSARRVSGRLEPEGDQSILAAIATIVAGGAAALGKAGVDIVRGAVEWVAHELEHGI
jgi:hypothetical protein